VAPCQGGCARPCVVVVDVVVLLGLALIAVVGWGLRSFDWMILGIL